MHEKIIKRQDDAAAADDAEISRDIVRAIVGEKGHVVLRFHSTPDQFRCEHACQSVDFLEGELLSAKLDECFPGTERCALLKDVIKRKDFSYHAGKYITVGGTIKAESAPMTGNNA